MSLTRLAVLACVVLAAVSPAEDKALPNAMQITLTRKHVERKGDRWVVQVHVKFTNTGKKVFALDKLTAALGGELANDVFEIASAQGPVDYRGMMAKRAHPGAKGFAMIAPGASVETVVDLGADYAFPPAGGRFSVKFSSANHFSVDDVHLGSEALVVELAP